MKTLLIATHNAKKVKEFEELLAPFSLTIKSSADFSLKEPEETGITFRENALIKARAGCASSGVITLADDSGFCVAALSGAPGVYSADWAETENGRDFSMAMEKVWERMGGAKDMSAWFTCVLALAYPDGRYELFEGRVDGHIVWPPRGDYGFGYDPMFVPEGYDKTFAEMGLEEKNAISHRARAVEKFLSYMRDYAV